MQYLKRKHFSHRIQFHTGKVWFIWKKNEKITFLSFSCQNFCFFSNKSYFFLFENEFYVKNAFFWGIACWNSSKITNFENFTHFQGFFTRLPIFASFGGSYGKKILKKGQMSWNWSHLSGKHDFWAKFSSRAKIDRGGSWSPPPRTWQGLSDVALIRVKSFASNRMNFF